MSTIVVLALLTGVRGLLILAGLAALIFGILGVLRRSWPRRILGSRTPAATILAAGLLLAYLGVVLTDPVTGAGTPDSSTRDSLAPATPSRDSSATPPVPTPAESSLTGPSADPEEQVPEPEKPATQIPKVEPEPGTALYALASLAVKGRAPKTGYDRDLFGTGWTDTDNNTCSTREDILRRDLRPVIVLAGTGGCRVIAGTLADPYSGTTLTLGEGGTSGDDIQIDHVVALSDAWQKGAQQWSSSKRVDFANHPLELLATDGPTNAAKSDGDTASWLPPNKSYRCTFVARQISIKARFGLWVTAAEKAAMERVLSTCSDQKVITSAAAAKRRSPSATVQRRETEQQSPPEREPEPAPEESATPTDEPDGSVYYRNCDAVRAAGADPIYVGDPGYSRRLDRDGDGVGCER